MLYESEVLFWLNIQEFPILLPHLQLPTIGAVMILNRSFLKIILGNFVGNHVSVELWIQNLSDFSNSGSRQIFWSVRIQIQLNSTGSWVKKVFPTLLYCEPVLCCILSSGISEGI
jgi:hypothetical protein